MSFKNFFIKTINTFFIIVTLVSVAMGVSGLIFAPDAAFSYGILFSPVIFGLLSVLPHFVFYSKKELSFKAQILRAILHLFLLEILLVSFVMIVNKISFINMIPIIIAIFIVDVLVHLISWGLDCRLAASLNESLKQLQTQNGGR